MYALLFLISERYTLYRKSKQLSGAEIRQDVLVCISVIHVVALSCFVIHSDAKARKSKVAHDPLKMREARVAKHCFTKRSDAKY